MEPARTADPARVDSLRSSRSQTRALSRAFGTSRNLQICIGITRLYSCHNVQRAGRLANTTSSFAISVTEAWEVGKMAHRIAGIPAMPGEPSRAYPPSRTRRNHALLYRGPDRRASRALSPAFHPATMARHPRTFPGVVLALAIAVATYLALGTGHQHAFTPRMAAAMVFLNTTFIVIVSLAIAAFVIERRITGRAAPLVIGTGVLLAFVIAPMASELPFLVHHLDLTTIAWTNILSLSTALAGSIILLSCVLWPQIDTAITCGRIAIAAIAITALFAVVIWTIPSKTTIELDAIAVMPSANKLADIPYYLLILGAFRWLALIACYHWRVQRSPEAIWHWARSAMLLGGIAYGADAVAPHGSSLYLVPGDILWVASAAMLLAGTVSSIDTALDTHATELREAATILHSWDLQREATRESYSRYSHDLRSSLTGVSLYLDHTLENARRPPSGPPRSSPFAGLEELVAKEIRQIEALARNGPITTTFDLRRMLERWSSTHLGEGCCRIDIPPGLLVTGPQDFISEVLTRLIPSYAALGGAPIEQVIIRAMHAFGHVVTEIVWPTDPQVAGPISPLAIEASCRAVRDHGADLWGLTGRNGIAMALKERASSTSALIGPSTTYGARSGARPGASWYPASESQA